MGGRSRFGWPRRPVLCFPRVAAYSACTCVYRCMHSTKKETDRRVPGWPPPATPPAASRPAAPSARAPCPWTRPPPAAARPLPRKGWRRPCRPRSWRPAGGRRRGLLVGVGGGWWWVEKVLWGAETEAERGSGAAAWVVGNRRDGDSRLLDGHHRQQAAAVAVAARRTRARWISAHNLVGRFWFWGFVLWYCWGGVSHSGVAPCKPLLICCGIHRQTPPCPTPYIDSTATSKNKDTHTQNAPQRDCRG